MADISKIKLPSGTTYDIKDSVARETKIDKPSTEGTSGQVLSTDGNGGTAWADQPDVITGIHVGEIAPTDPNVQIWLQPDGESDVVGIEAEATQLPAGSSPTAEFDASGDVLTLQLGLPAPEKGDRGDTVIIATRYEDLTFPVDEWTYCLYNNLPYVSKQAISTSEAWTAAHWEQVSFEDEIGELKNALQDIGNPPNLRESTEENVDLDIADENGNVLARFSNGDIHTKNFSSARILGCKLTDTENVDLDISDIFGNVVARFSDGHIKTKNFDSSDMTIGPLKGKVIVNFGDSIFGNRRAPNDISTAIANATGATVYNCGFGGCRMAAYVSSGLSTWGQFSMFELADAIVENDWSGQDAAVADTGWTNMPAYFPDTLTTLESIDFSTVDIVTIAYGANDFNGAVVVDDDQNPLSTSTFAGALRYSIEKLLTAYPQLRIFCLGQIYGWYSGTGGVFVDDTNTHELNGQKLSDFIEATEKVAHEYNLPFINNYNIGIGKFTRYQYLVDTSHPNQAGTDLMAEHIVNELF